MFKIYNTKDFVYTPQTNKAKKFVNKYEIARAKRFNYLTAPTGNVPIYQSDADTSMFSCILIDIFSLYSVETV